MKIILGILAVVGVGLLAAIVWKMNGFEQRLSEMESRTVSLEPRLGAVEKQVKIVDQRMVSLEGGSAPVEHEGHAYLVISDPMRWVDAKAYAEKLGGYLVVVTSEQENRFVADLARSKKVYQAIWIGLSDEAVEGQWQWVNGEPVSFTAWEPGEPNGGRGENYVNIGHASTYTWNDGSGWSRQPFVVEFNSIKDVKAVR